MSGIIGRIDYLSYLRSKYLKDDPLILLSDVIDKELQLQIEEVKKILHYGLQGATGSVERNDA